MQRLQLIGYTDGGMPVYSVTGGAPEGEDGGAGEDAPEGGEDDQPEEQPDEYSPPSEAEWKRTQAALKRANSEAANRRKWLDKHGIDPRNGERYDADEDEEQPEDEQPALKPKAKKKPDDGDEIRITQADLDRLDKQRRAEGKRAAAREATLTRALAKKGVAAGLQEAGWNGKGATLIERMIDVSELEIDDDGEIIGLADQIADVKTEMPEWFKKPRAVRANNSGVNGGAREVDGADKRGKQPAKNEPNGWLTRISAQMDGQDA